MIRYWWHRMLRHDVDHFANGRLQIAYCVDCKKRWWF